LARKSVSSWVIVANDISLAVNYIRDKTKPKRREKKDKWGRTGTGKFHGIY